MPLYQCQKQVRALKIEEIELGLMCSEESTLKLAGGYIVRRDTAWMTRHLPEVGGYFVRYADGYCSYSPAKAFEEGYTLA